MVSFLEAPLPNLTFGNSTGRVRCAITVTLSILMTKLVTGCVFVADREDRSASFPHFWFSVPEKRGVHLKLTVRALEEFCESIYRYTDVVSAESNNPIRFGY